MWLAVSPLMAAGVLVAHVLAYRLTGTAPGPLHAYLDHSPQLLLVLAVVGLAFGGLAARLRIPAAWPFPVAALATFVVQEHVERFVHGGDVPWLLNSRVFLVGLLLQLPVALLAWALARRLLVALAESRLRRPRVPRILLELARPTTRCVPGVATAAQRGRGPPLLHTL